MPHSSASSQNQPTATATLPPAPTIVFGQVIPSRSNAVVPMSSRSGSSSSLYSYFEKRSFHRVAFILGLGSAAIVGWYAYQYYCSQKAKKSSSVVEEIGGQESTDTVTRKQSQVSQDGYLSDMNENQVSDTDSDLLDKKVVLYQCPRGYFTPCIAPFALKLETFLRVASIPYEIKFKGQPQTDDAPWITIGKREISESQKCIPSLCQIFNIDLHKDASESRKSASNLVDNTLDNRIFWGIAMWRWVYDGGNSMKEIQPVAVPMASQMIQDVCESVKKAAWYHGIGRHSQEEVVGKVNKDLNDLAVALGKHNYFMGERPGEVDCNAFAMLSQMVWNMPKSPFELEIKKYPNLVSFIFRMKEKYWPDWSDILHSPDTESMASESVRLYSTGEFTRSRTGITSGSSSKSSNIHLSREPSVSSTSKSRKSDSEVQSKSQVSQDGGNDNNFHGSQNTGVESEIRKVNSDRSSYQHDQENNRQLGNSLNLSQSHPEQLYSNPPTTINPFLGDDKTHNNGISQNEINNLLSTLANEQMHQSNPPHQQTPEYYQKYQTSTNFNFNGQQQQYQNSFIAANRSSSFPGQIINPPSQPLATHAYPQSQYNPQQQYGNYDSAYHDQAKYFQIRDAIHAVTAQNSPAGGRDNYSNNITKLNQILNDLSISQPQAAFEHSIPQRQWSTPAHQPQQPQHQQQMYYLDAHQYGQQQQQPMMNPPTIQNPNNPFM